MNKSELITTIHEKVPNLSKKEIEEAVNTIIDTMREALIRGDRIEIRGFGSFNIKQRDARIGRNPRTGEKVQIPPKRVPFFTVGKELKERINSNGTH